jgi:KTSC domain-containing protein
MEHTSIASSSIRSAGYDSQTMIMEVAFVNESIYQYFEVPEHIFQGLLTAPSAGIYLNTVVKGAYRYTRL